MKVCYLWVEEVVLLRVDGYTVPTRFDSSRDNAIARAIASSSSALCTTFGSVLNACKSPHSP